jgi:hypothetical protein
MAAYTSTNLIAAINRRAFTPTDQVTFSDTDLLALADEELETCILPEVISQREEFYVDSQDVQVLVGQQAYSIPNRAIGNSLREVKYLLSNEIRNLARMEPEEVTSSQAGQPERFYLQDSKILLYPPPSSSVGTLRLFFSRSPSKLVPVSSVGTISAVTPNSVTVNSIPLGWSAANTFDIVSAQGQHEAIASDLAAASVSSNTVTFVQNISSLVKIGDFVSLSEETALVQLPKEYRVCLAQAVSVRILESMRLPGASEEMQKLMKMLENVQKLTSPRVAGENRVIVPANWFN